MPRQHKGYPKADIAIIGGSGLYEMEGLEQVREIRPSTPFGRPSDALVLGVLDGRQVAFLSRHGREHRLNPTTINYRANIHALKSVGVTQIFSVSAVGSMKKRVKPGDIVVPNQFIDRTQHRERTFFDQGMVAHVSFADPVCHRLAHLLIQSGQAQKTTVHTGGTYLCIEGPQFSSRAESLLYRQWGVKVIGMTNLPEARLAREAEMCYATLALVTDYDCWHETEDDVSVEAILSIMHRNVEVAKHVLRRTIQKIPDDRTCSCGQVLDQAVVTAPQVMTKTTRQRYQLLLQRYLAKFEQRSR
ncbi:MAG: S-methyl-5'-thioadenosine phosphorylase [Nitrospirales bacterium]|nr:S-methyl-5'-thioadenosine phosphorylase [Nitrospirales bacterium]